MTMQSKQRKKLVKKIDGDLDELWPTEDCHGEDDLEEKNHLEKNVHFSDNDEVMKFDKENEKNDFWSLMVLKKYQQ